MPERILDIHALTPLLLRDGRPFGATGDEARARSLPAPLPSTLAGFVRTQVGQAGGWNWQHHNTLKAAHDIPVWSALLFRDGLPMLPAPRNAVIDKMDKVWRTAPQELKAGEGCDLPGGLRPLGFTEEAPADFKPESGYVYWPAGALTRWLLNQPVRDLKKISGPPLEERTHVAINPQTGTADDGQLFGVSYRSFEERELRKDDGASSPIREYERHAWSIRVRAKLPEDAAPQQVGHLGGERRPVGLRILEDKSADWFRMPEELKTALRDEKNTRLCMILTTPAIFEDGWKPGWLSRDPGPQLPAGLSALRPHLNLVGAAVGRREAVSGWSLREQQPKAVRWMVPAGSMYFFEVGENAPGDAREKLLEAWLRPVSDRQADQKDGYGAAAWGIW